MIDANAIGRTVGQNIPQLAARMCAQCANGRRCVSVGGTESILTASVGVMAMHTPAIAPHAWTPSKRLRTSDSFDQKQNNRLNYCSCVLLCVLWRVHRCVRGGFRFVFRLRVLCLGRFAAAFFGPRMCRVARALGIHPGRELHRSDTVGAT